MEPQIARSDAALIMLGRREPGTSGHSRLDLVRRAWTALREALVVGWMVAPLGADHRARLKLFTTTVVLRARSGLGRPARKPARLWLEKLGRRFSMVVADYGDMTAVRDVLLNDEYRVDLEPPPEVILDLGAHIGASVAYFKLLYPRAAVYAVEPDPATRERLRENVAQFDAVTVRGAAVGAAGGSATLYRDNESTASSLKREEEGLDGVAVEALTIETLLAELRLERVDLLKLDIEGAELDALRSFAGLSDVRAVVGELHPRLIEGSPDDFFELLADSRSSAAGRAPNPAPSEAPGPSPRGGA